MNNPYNSTKPGNLIVGRDRLRQQLLRGARNGNSFAVLGGRRIGKTSLLMELQKDFLKDSIEQEKNSPALSWIPCYVSLQGLDSIAPIDIFRKLYSEALEVSEISDGPGWSEPSDGRPYDAFQTQLGTLSESFAKQLGSQWRLIFLLDELDTLSDHLDDDQFFQNLRHFLMNSPFSGQVQVIVSGSTKLVDLIQEGSPLNNLRHKYLAALSKKEALPLIQFGFDGNLPQSIEKKVFKLSGGHPYLIQGILEFLYDEGELDKTALNQAVTEFKQEQSNFENWFSGWTGQEQEVYLKLANQSKEESLTTSLLADRMGCSVGEVEEALLVLEYHGVIHPSQREKPRVAGTLFRDWFLARQPPISAMPIDKQEVFISYGWESKSQRVVEELCEKLESQGLCPIRDVDALVYRNSIVKFMDRLAAGGRVIVVVSDKYLRSRNCMYELLKIKSNGDFEKRIFPIRMPDAKIYEGLDHLDYVQYWGKKEKKLDNALKNGSSVQLNEVQKELNHYHEIRDNIDHLLGWLKDRLLISVSNEKTDFAPLFDALKED